MEQRKINPWKWQDQYGFSQGIEVTNASRVLYCAGQASVDENGKPVHVGDMRKQLEQAFRNLEAVLKASGYG
ncbi:MAG TPA: Rid family hydrolase, partial [Gammaproteobacteria bacterium]|nr:Rid family hydrolase [Gammaproteobacteria bacterium]